MTILHGINTRCITGRLRGQQQHQAVSSPPSDTRADDPSNCKSEQANSSRAGRKKAFTLDGDGDFIEIPTDRGLDFGRKDFTILLWVKFNSLEREQVLIEKWVQKFGPPSIGWTLTKLEDNRIRLAMGPQGATSEFNVDTPILNISPNAWIQVAARRSGKYFGLFVNGRLIVTRSAEENLPFILRSESSLKFGHRCSPSDTSGCDEERGGFFLNGQIDEVQLFNGRALPGGVDKSDLLGGCPGRVQEALR